MNNIKTQVATSGSFFIPRLPAYGRLFYPEFEKEEDVLVTLEKALYVHNKFFKQHPTVSVYESCGSRACPDATGSHYVVESFQLTKAQDKYILIVGMSMNRGGTPIAWKISELESYRSFSETIIELTAEQFQKIFQ